MELALKKTDYLVVDDRAAPIPHAGQEGGARSVTKAASGPFDDSLGSDPWAELSKPLRPTEIAGTLLQLLAQIQLIGTDVHVKAAAFIASAPNPLEALQHISQDFPKYSAALARQVNITDAVQSRIDFMERRGQVDPAVVMNGRSIPAEEINAFSYVMSASRL